MYDKRKTINFASEKNLSYPYHLFFSIIFFKMKKVKLLFLFAFATSVISTFAQDRVGYAYDEAGNRVKREIVIVQAAKASGKKPGKNTSFHDMLGEKSIRITSSTSGRINVQVLRLLPTDEGIISVCTTSGAEVFRQRIITSENTVDLRSLPRNVYLLNITINGIPTTWRIAKK